MCLHVYTTITDDTDESPRYPSSWSTPEVQRLFNTTTNKVANGTSTSSSNPSSQPTLINIRTSSNILGVGAIAGIVAGSIAVVLCLIGGIFLVRRRRMQQNTKRKLAIGPKPAFSDSPTFAELPNTPFSHQRELESNMGRFELRGHFGGRELQGHLGWEMEGDLGGTEMYKGHSHAREMDASYPNRASERVIEKQ